MIGDPAAGPDRGRATPSIFFNFRPDRARQLTRALIDPGFAEFDRGPAPPLPCLVQMTEYADDIRRCRSRSRPRRCADVLAAALAAAGVAQLHVAETEKYAHVTYFFNGGREHRQRRGAVGAGPLAPRRRHLRPGARR